MPVNNLIQLRRGSDWSSNPTLSSGEPGFDIANNVLKIGDGSTTWSELKEIGSFAELYSGDLDGAVVVECKNSTGATIPAGTPVYVSGYYSTNGKALVSVAKANDSSKMPAIGLLEFSLANDAEGYVHCFGLADQLDSSSFSVGNTVYVHPTGGLTNTRPTGTSELVQNIGRVLRSDSTQGRILILGPGRTNDVPNSGSFSILNINDAFTFPTSDGSANQVLKTDGAGTLSWADDSTGAGGGGGSVTTVKSTGVQVGGADIVTLDFSSDFSISESPDTEINIAIIKPKRYSVTSTSNTFSSFTTAETYASGQIDIFQNGIKLHDGTDFTATNGSGVTLSNYAPSGSVIEYIISMTMTSVATEQAASDEYTNSLLLYPFDSDANDASSTGNNLTLTNASIDTSVKKYGAGSLKFTGSLSNGKAQGVMPSLGTGDFTIEFWLYMASMSSNQYILDRGQGSNAFYDSPGFAFLTTSSSRFYWEIKDSYDSEEAGYATSVGIVSSSLSSAVGSWVHVALVRQGTTYRMYIDGTQETSGTGSATDFAQHNFAVGDAMVNGGGVAQNSYIDDFRLSNTAVYPDGTTFTVPSAAHPTS